MLELLRVGNRRERLEREVQTLLRTECVLEHVRRIRKGLVDIAAPQLGAEREIGVFLSLEVLEVGEGARRL